ncbi:thioesterase family protein [Aequorivita sp. Q41]|uniref:thioesterase family protein n=1 Tax=Aequorivita sp. Q41 TaxID=3153300 RepID=UPI0032421DE1
MFYYWLHMIYTYLGSRIFWKNIKLTANLTRTRRVNILDCESFRFMANSKYFYYMDLIRYEVVFRSKLYDNTIKKGMFGVLASQKIIYKKPLKIFKKFDITLKLEGSDEKWVYHRQTFEQNGQICAIGFTKSGFWKHKQVQNMREIIINCDSEYEIRPPAAEVLSMFENDYKTLKINN